MKKKYILIDLKSINAILYQLYILLIIFTRKTYNINAKYIQIPVIRGLNIFI